MPIYEYICKECQHQFEALVYGKEKAECPKCHTKKLAPQLSVFAVSAKGSSPVGIGTKRLRIVRGSTRSRRLLTRRHELGQLPGVTRRGFECSRRVSAQR